MPREAFKKHGDVHLKKWFAGEHGGAGFTFGLDDLVGLFPPK